MMAALMACGVSHQDLCLHLSVSHPLFRPHHTKACAALDFRPPGWLMIPLVAALQQQLGLLTPADLAGEWVGG